MPRRHRHKIGSWLVEDEETGTVRYREKIVRRGFDGLLVTKGKQEETRHPQEFVRAGNDPRAVFPVRPQQLTPVPNCGTLYTRVVSANSWSNGFSNGFGSNVLYYILAPPGPFFPFNFGIAKDVVVTARSAEIECTLAVRADNELQSGEQVR